MLIIDLSLCKYKRTNVGGRGEGEGGSSRQDALYNLLTSNRVCMVHCTGIFLCSTVDKVGHSTVNQFSRVVWIQQLMSRV